MNGAAIGALIAAVVLLAANAFFVTAEFALVASRASRLESAAAGGDKRSLATLATIRNLQTHLAGAQLGITLASLGLGLMAEPAVARLIEPLIEMVVEVPSGVLHTISFTLALILVVIFHVILGEMVPKNIAIAQPERTAKILTPALRIYGLLLRPVVWFLNAVSTGIVRMLGMEPVDEINTALTINEFQTLLAGAREQGVIDPSEHELLTGALSLRSQSIGSIMIPADQLVSVSHLASVATVEQVIASTGHTRIPVEGNSPDDIRGFFHAKDVLRMSPGNQHRQLSTEFIRPMPTVDSKQPVRGLMLSMSRSRIHIALVCDEQGATLGIVTLEDVLEALVGAIYDETDKGNGHSR